MSAILALICAISFQAAPAGRSKVVNFSLQNVAGGVLTSDELKGKVAVIDVWATWCGHCVDEIKIYNQLSDEFQNQNVAIVGIATDSPLKQIPAKVRQLGIRYPVLIGDATTLQTFGVQGFPTTVVLDQDGKIYKRYVGEVPGKQDKIRQDVQHLLSQEPNP